MPALAEFVVDIERDLEGATLAWPEKPDADDLEGNHFYQDLRGFNWGEVRATIAIEQKLVTDFQAAATDAEGVAVIASVHERNSSGSHGDPWGTDPFWGLDPGICSTVKALSAAGCVPYYSCNGGSFGDHHAGTCPIVAFFMRPEFKNTLIDCAEQAGVGVRSQDGRVQVYARDLPSMLEFAQALVSRLGNEN